MARSGKLMGKVRSVRAGRVTSKTRKSAATRERIMQAARDLIRDRGGFDFQMSEVSESCNLSKGSLYYYFANRDELVEAICNGAVDDFVEAVERIAQASTGALDAIVKISYETVRRFGAGSSLSMAVTRELCGAGSDDVVVAYTSGGLRRVTDILTDAFERAKQEGRVRESVNARLAAMSLLGVFVLSAAVPGPDGRSDPSIDEADVRQLLCFAMEGVGTKAGCEALAASGAPSRS